MCVYMYIYIPTSVETESLYVCLALSLSHKGTFNCIFPVLGIVPFAVCMKWSYNTVYLPAAELNENNKHFHLTDALNLLKTFSSLTRKERVSTVLCELKWEGNGDLLFP